MLSKRITISGFPKATVERLEQIIAEKIRPSHYRIEAHRGGGWDLMATTGKSSLALNGKLPCLTLRELGDLVIELHADGVLGTDDVAELFEQIELLHRRKR